MGETATDKPAPALYQLSRKLQSIGKIEKCEACSCYVDTIKEFDAVLAGEATPDAESARSVIAGLTANHKTEHGCIGCDPCYPVSISNALYALSDGESVGATQESCGSSRGCEAPTPPALQAQPAAVAPDAWTVETGDYRLGAESGCVAIATLASEDLYKSFSEALCADACSICGKVFTENIGIEKVVKNIIANRHIRFLILCGKEAQGHLTGTCIKALHRGGVTEKGKIAGAPGKRPFIKTLTPAQVMRFQNQVEVIDMVGCEDREIIEAVARKLAARNPGAMPDAVIAEGVPRHVASDKVTLKLDKAGFLIIHPQPGRDWLVVEHYKNSGEPTCIVEGSDPAMICAELIGRGLVSQLDHAAYLGRELERAKLSMRLGFPFVQDRAFGEFDAEPVSEW